jgi:transposase-like protein
LTKDLSDCQHLILDGTILEGRRGIFVVMDASNFAVVHGAYDISEKAAKLQQFCNWLAKHKLAPASATVDGNPPLIRVLRAFWPQIKIQRCLVHIQRQGLSWCRRFPKRTDAKHLRELFRGVAAIRSQTEKESFLNKVQEWENRYGAGISSAPDRGWVLSDLKRARSMLLTALPDMFHYLENPNIPTSTNALEGYYARLKQKYRQHRGLARRNRDSYFRWYLHLCPR